MNRLVVLFFFLFISSGISAQEHPNWELIFANDENGKAISGHINDLVDAVRNGEELRIYWSSESKSDPSKKVEHFASAKFLTILSDRIVFAQIDPIIGQTPSFENQTLQLKENLEWSMIAGSNGKMDTMMRNVVSGKVVGHGTRGMAIKWYVKS